MIQHDSVIVNSTHKVSTCRDSVSYRRALDLDRVCPPPLCPLPGPPAPSTHRGPGCAPCAGDAKRGCATRPWNRAGGRPWPRRVPARRQLVRVQQRRNHGTPYNPARHLISLRKKTAAHRCIMTDTCADASRHVCAGRRALGCRTCRCRFRLGRPPAAAAGCDWWRHDARSCAADDLRSSRPDRPQSNM